MKPKQSLQRIPLDRLVSHDHNRALNQARVDEMADSIQEHGILTPLIITEHLTDFNRWLILDGHHRAAAAQQLGMSLVLCVIRHGLDEDQDEQLIVMLVGNCQRQEMSAMDRAELFGVLRRSGLSIADIAKRSGLSEGWVSDSLSLLELDGDTRDRVRAGDVGVGQAKQAIRQVRAVRRAPIGGPAPKRKSSITVEAAHFTGKHPLAEAVRRSCDHHDTSAGRVRPTVGGVGCGQCWEAVIRSDEKSAGGAA